MTNIFHARVVALCLLLMISALPVRHCNAEDAASESMSLVAIGARYGTNAGTNERGAVDRVDVFGSWRTPYTWELTPG